MVKYKTVQVNPVEKLNPEQIKAIFDQNANWGKTQVEEQKKVKRKKKKDGTGSGGDDPPDPNDTRIKPEDLFWNDLEIRNNNNPLVWNAPFVAGNTKPVIRKSDKPKGKKSQTVVQIPLANQRTTDIGDPEYGKFAADMIKAANSYTKTKDGEVVPITTDKDMYNIMINRRLRPLDVQKFLIRQANAISDNDMESKFAKPSLGVVSNTYSDAAANLQNEVVRFQTALDKNKPAYKRSKASDFIETRYSSENGTPKLFWGALIGAGINMASSLIGGIKAKNQAAEQARLMEQQRLKEEAAANLASDQVQLKSYIPSNNPGYFAAGGVVENNSFTTPQYGKYIAPNAQFLTNADGSTYGDHSTGNEVPIYNKDKKLIALAHPREILYTKPDGDQVVLSEARGYSQAYSALQSMINEKKIKLFKSGRDPKGEINEDIKNLTKAQVGLVAKQEQAGEADAMKCGGKVKRKELGGNPLTDDPQYPQLTKRSLGLIPTNNAINLAGYTPMINGNDTGPKFSNIYNELNNTLELQAYNVPGYEKFNPTVKPSIVLQPELDLTKRTAIYNDPSAPEKQTFWDKAKGVMATPEFQNAAIGTVGNVASNLISNSYLSAADKMMANLKPVHTRYAPINERVDTSGQEASAQNAFNLAKSEIDNISDPTRRSALLNDLTSRYVSNSNEIAGNRINAEIAKQNTNINAANQVSAQNAVASNAFNQYKAESRAGILGAKATNMGAMMTKIMQGIQDYRLSTADKAKLDMVLQRFKSGVADRMDYSQLESLFGIINSGKKEGK